MASNTNSTPFNGRGQAHRKAGSPGSEQSGHANTMPRQPFSTDVTSPYSYSGSPMTQDTSFMLSPTENRKADMSNSFYSFAGMPDPFTSQPRSTSLNAAASSFQPTVADADRSKKNNISAESFGASYLQGVIDNNEPAPEQPTKWGIFTKDSGKSRTLKIACVLEGTSVQSFIKLLSRRLAGEQSYHALSDKVIFVKHTHISDATVFFQLLSTLPDISQVSYYSTKSLADIFPQFAGRVTDHEGQMFVTAKLPPGAQSGIGKHAFEAKVREQLEMQGTLYAQQSHPSAVDELNMTIEFDNAESVPRAVQRLNGVRIDGSPLTLRALHPDVMSDPYASVASSLNDMSASMGAMSLGNPQSFGTGLAAMLPQVTSMVPQATLGNSMMYGNPSVMYYDNGSMMPVPYNQQYIMVAPMPAHYLQQPFINPYQSGGGDFNHRGGYGGRPRGDYGDGYGGGYGGRPYGRGSLGRRNHHDDESGFKKTENMVRMDKIHAGADVRTTVMLRNIPNKMTQPELKAILDDSSRGKYDFLYLRIDFSNNCNVGYAFINFLDPLDIIPFIERRANRRWDTYRSDKVAEVSYATIQGRDCLIQKFRNSSVMLEGQECRPKLFYTEGHPMCGNEEPFPVADNQSKLQRSCQNAEHVGLFAPAVGQHFRHEQRYRNSQYDRGTSMAIRERDFDDTFRGGFIEFDQGYNGQDFGRGRGGGFGRGRSFAPSYRGGYEGVDPDGSPYRY